MGQRVVTSLNHLDLKKIKIKGDKSTRRGDHFWESQKRTHVGETKKETERESREEEKIDSPVLLSTN